MKNYYRGLHIFATDSNNDYYVSFKEGHIEVIRVERGGNPDYAYDKDKIVLLDEISELYTKYSEAQNHKELIQAISNLGKSIEKRFEELDEKTAVCAKLAVSSNGLMYNNAVLATRDILDEKLVERENYNEVKDSKTYHFIEDLNILLDLNLDRKQIVDLCKKPNIEEKLESIVKEYC